MRLKHVHMVSHANSNLASHRMRVIKPCELLQARGYKATFSAEIDPSADINCFSKHLNPVYDQQMIQILKSMGATTAMDNSDSHVHNPRIMGHYDLMNREADIVICNGPTLLKLIAERTGKTPYLVKDPITFPEYPPRFNLDNPKLLWYGHSTNIKPLVGIAKDLTNLTVITNQEVDVPNASFISWGQGVVEAEIFNHDIVVIPLGGDETKMYKNTNRVVDALHAGRFVVTDSVDVYGELEPFIFIGGISEGIEWAKRNKDKAYEMVRLGQNYVKEIYGDARIADQWEFSLFGVDRMEKRSVGE